ncbi:MAG TPA: ABC transporter permease, partial [Nitrospirota bacterium]|nr:ABC transporter permease [Nitrospirota bacterium]
VVLLLPLLLVLAFATALGTGLWLSALNVRFRDVRYVVPFFVQIWLFVTPVIYPTGRVTEMLARAGLPAWLYGLNPMVGVIEGFRWSLLGTGNPDFKMIAISSCVVLALLIGGLMYFKRMEQTFADVI